MALLCTPSVPYTRIRLARKGNGNICTCWHWSADECQWESETTVTNCGDYFVYYLRDLPFACNGVFCGE